MTEREQREKQFRELLPEDRREVDLSIFSDVELNALIAAAIRIAMRAEQPRKRTRRR
jgi:hypothetical protein